MQIRFYQIYDFKLLDPKIAYYTIEIAKNSAILT